MSQKVPKDGFIIDDESIDEDIINKEQKEEEKKLSEEEIQEKIKKHEERKAAKAEERERKKDRKKTLKSEIQEKTLQILSKGKVSSKSDLTNLLIKKGIKDYYYKINLISNQIRVEIPHIGAALKELRFDKEINFRIVDGSHVYYKGRWDKKTLKTKHSNQQI